MKDIKLLRVIDLILWGERVLKEAGFDNSRQEAEILLSFSMDTPFKSLLMRLNEEVSPNVESYYRKLVMKRQEHHPLQYLTGIQYFMSLEFEVNEYVLIPRWDTERLVERALELLKKKEQPWVIDVGTGSGAIAVSLAKYHAQVNIFALDISPQALEIAKRNACRHGVEKRVTFFSGDLLSPILNSSLYQNIKFDAVVSNPPYIPREQIKDLPKDVQKEPHLALDGGEDGLTCYRDLLPQVKKVLKPGGYLLLEIGFDQAKDVEEICRTNDFADISVSRDYAQRDRVISACNKG
ncbi:MAG: peptide chain release factor N(5)-glutamine methyltransferase [Dehalobacterium sp.]